MRQVWADICRGIAIMLVVYSHASRGLEASGKISFDGMWGAVDYLVYCVHMPVFFFASGYFFDASLRKGSSRFWWVRAETIVWPYFLWTFLHTGAQIAGQHFGATNNAFTPDMLLYVLWKPISLFWFLHALFFSLLISWLLKSANKLVLVTVSAIMLIVAVKVFKVQVTIDIAYGLFYFTFGRIVADVDITVWLTTRKSLLALPIFAIASVAGYIFGLTYYLNVIAGVSAIVLVCALSFAIAKWTPAISFPIALIGAMSMGIYVMHITVLGIARAVSNHLFGGSVALTLPFAICVATAVPLMAQYLLNRLGIAKYFGLPAKIPDRVKPDIRQRIVGDSL